MKNNKEKTTMYGLLEQLETLIEKWESKPYTQDLTQAVYMLCAKELRKIIGENDADQTAR